MPYVAYRPTASATSFTELTKEKKTRVSSLDVLKMNQNWGLVFRLDGAVTKLVNKVADCTYKLDDFYECSQGYIPYRLSDLVEQYGERKGKQIKQDRLWHSMSKSKEFWIQEMYGRDISKYVASPTGEFVKYGKHVATYVDLKFFTKRRVVVREITNPTIIACILDAQCLNDPQLIPILEREEGQEMSLEFVWAILNSRLATFYHFNHSPKATKGAFPKILIQDIKNFPLPRLIEHCIVIKLNNLVYQILSAKKQNPAADTSKLEEKIDKLVYRLYGLTKPEMRLLRGNLRCRSQNVAWNRRSIMTPFSRRM